MDDFVLALAINILKVFDYIRSRVLRYFQFVEIYVFATLAGSAELAMTYILSIILYLIRIAPIELVN